MTTAIEGGKWSAARAGRTLLPGKDPVPIVQEAGWAPGPVWTGAQNLAPIGIRSPDLAARSQSLYRLSYPALIYTCYECKFQRSSEIISGNFKRHSAPNPSVPRNELPYKTALTFLDKRRTVKPFCLAVCVSLSVCVSPLQLSQQMTEFQEI
jgi:hypothetical protein